VSKSPLCHRVHALRGNHMTNDELNELQQVESHLQWLLDLVQRRIDACGAGEGLNNPARQAEALAGIEENKRIASAQVSANLLPSTAAELEEVAWLNEHVGQVQAGQARVPNSQCVPVQRTKLKKSAKSR
jgi:hypothetical protein